MTRFMVSGQLIVMILAMNPLSAVGNSVGLFGSDTGGFNLFKIDRDTAAADEVGVSGVRIAGLDFDAKRGRLYGVSVSQPELFIMDRLTGQAVAVPGSNIGSIDGASGAEGLAYDSVRDVLYASHLDRLYVIDPTTGLATSIVTMTGSPADPEIEGLAFDPLTDTLFGLYEAGNVHIVKIDPLTGTQTELPSPLPSDVWRGLAFDVRRRVLYASTADQDALYRIDPVTGAPELVGPITGTIAIQGLAVVVPEPPSWLLLILSCGALICALPQCAKSS